MSDGYGTALPVDGDFSLGEAVKAFPSRLSDQAEAGRLRRELSSGRFAVVCETEGIVLDPKKKIKTLAVPMEVFPPGGEAEGGWGIDASVQAYAPVGARRV